MRWRKAPRTTYYKTDILVALETFAAI